MFHELEKINHRPKSFEFYTAADLWNDKHTAKQMLAYHLNTEIDISSRKVAFIDSSVKWIVSHFHVGNDTKIADFGCGPGLYTTRLAKCNADVTGIDFSRSSIEHAQKIAIENQLNIQYVNQNYLDFETKNRFNLILMIMCDFCALSPIQRQEILTKFYTYLMPNGVILLDVYSLNAFVQREEVVSYKLNLLDGFWSSKKYYGFLNTFIYEIEKVVLDKYTIFESDRTQTVYNWLQYFSPESLQKEFREAGFMLEVVYADVAGSTFDATSNEFAVVGRKV